MKSQLIREGGGEIYQQLNNAWKGKSQTARENNPSLLEHWDLVHDKIETPDHGHVDGVVWTVRYPQNSMTQARKISLKWWDVISTEASSKADPKPEEQGMTTARKMD